MGRYSCFYRRWLLIIFRCYTSSNVRAYVTDWIPLSFADKVGQRLRTLGIDIQVFLYWHLLDRRSAVTWNMATVQVARSMRKAHFGWVEMAPM